MRLFARTSIGVLTVLALAAPAAAQQAALTSPSVSTEGHASMKVTPDIAWITMTAESRAVRTADAQKQNAIAIDGVRTSLKAAGAPEDAMKTRNYSLEPQMQYTDGKSKVIGYIARQSLEVRVDDLSKIGAYIDAAGGSGATSISDIRYDVKDRNAIETRLLTDAVRDALKRATAMAAGAGKEVMTIWRIETQPGAIASPPAPMYRMSAQAASAPPTQVTPDEIELQARVTVTAILK